MTNLAGAGHPSLAASGAQAQQAQTQWSALKAAAGAGAGQLYFEPGAAEQCAQACQRAADEIEEQIAKAGQLEFVVGFGETQAGRDLSAKFLRKAHDARTVLMAHQQALWDMRDTFRAAGKTYGEADTANSQKFSDGR